MSGIIYIQYRELSYSGDDATKWPSIRDSVSSEPQQFEEAIARYLEGAPSYSGLGKIVGDVLDPTSKVTLFPGMNTDGVYIWPAELAYYVRTYHVRVPQGLVEHMASLNWQPPTEGEIDWDEVVREA
jgi:hypothetical protein